MMILVVPVGTPDGSDISPMFHKLLISFTMNISEKIYLEACTNNQHIWLINNTAKLDLYFILWRAYCVQIFPAYIWIA